MVEYAAETSVVESRGSEWSVASRTVFDFVSRQVERADF
jgi:hypothetical protein